jgi:uncharacterized membrane protein YebE (DUF533 family)
MFNPEKLLGGLISGGFGKGIGSRGRGRAALAMGALGVAVAAFEHFMEPKAAAGPRSAGSGMAPPAPPLTAPSVPPPAPGSGPPPPPPATETGAGDTAPDAVWLIRAMIASAAADGEIDPQERDRIVERIERTQLDEEERAFIEAELAAPRDAAEIARQAESPEMARKIYAVSLLAVAVDNSAERRYLSRLADLLGLKASDRANVHELLDIPPLEEPL